MTIWTGIAVLVLKSEHPSRKEGYLGAYAALACEATTVSEAIQAAEHEFDEHALLLIGLENFLPTHIRDRQLTNEEDRLIKALSSYPVQFRNVHFHKGDS